MGRSRTRDLRRWCRPALHRHGTVGDARAVAAPLAPARSTPAMDLLKAEIERKRKAKAEEFGGNKYVKRSHITAVREGKLRAEEEQEWRLKHGKGPDGPGSAAEEARLAEEASRLKQLQGDAEDKNAKLKVRASPSVSRVTLTPPRTKIRLVARAHPPPSR